jgi:fumarylacetoacetase
MQDTLMISFQMVKTWRLVRNRIADLFDEENPKLRDIAKHRDIVIFNIDEVEMQLPVLIGDYTDFYSSKEHATNVGKMCVIQKMLYYLTGFTYP